MFDSPVANAFLFGTLGAASLPLGALIGMWLRPSVRLTAAVMAFGAGALLAAMSFELVLPAMDNAGFAPLALGFFLGCGAFVGLNQLLNGQGAFLRKAATIGQYARRQKQRKLETLIDELSHVDIFRSLPPEEVQALVPYMTERHFPAGTVVFNQGDAGDALYIVDEGTVAIMRTENGRTTTLARLTVGQTFGEMALLSGETRMAAAVVLESARVWQIRKEDFDRILDASPALRDAAVELMDERKLRTATLMQAEQWRARALDSLDPATLQLTAVDIEEVVREARGRGAAAFAIWLGAGLDGVGESFVIGATAVGAAVSMPLVGGIFLSNLPEAMSSAATMKRQGTSPRVILWLWTSLVFVAGTCAALGYFLLAGARPASFALFEGAAAGAMLSMIAQTMLPEAFENGGGSAVAIMTVTGFLAALLIRTIS